WHGLAVGDEIDPGDRSVSLRQDVPEERAHARDDDRRDLPALAHHLAEVVDVDEPVLLAELHGLSTERAGHVVSGGVIPDEPERDLRDLHHLGRVEYVPALLAVLLPALVLGQERILGALRPEPAALLRRAP